MSGSYRHRFRVWHLSWLLSAGLLAAPSAARAAERVVLAEEFSSWW